MSDPKYVAFLEAARTGSMSKAALLLHYTQPGVANLISSLEYEIGAKLFYRSATGVSLTPCGEAILPYVEKSREYSDMAIQTAREFVKIMHSRIFVGVLPCVARRWLPSVIRALKEREPAILVIPLTGTAEAIERDLFESRVHCAILPDPSREGLDVVELGEDPYVAVIPAGHRLAKRKLLVPQDLAKEDIIRSEEVPDDEFKAILQRMESAPRILYTMADDVSAVEMVRAGLGVSFLPSLALGGELPSGVAAVPVRGARRTMVLATLTGEYRRLTDDSFRDACIETIRNKKE